MGVISRGWVALLATAASLFGEEAKPGEPESARIALAFEEGAALTYRYVVLEDTELEDRLLSNRLDAVVRWTVEEVHPIEGARLAGTLESCEWSGDAGTGTWTPDSRPGVSRPPGISLEVAGGG